MQTSFYASGFLYSLKTHQILLIKSQENTDSPSQWSTLGGEGQDGEQAHMTFQRVVNRLLNLNLKPKDIHAIYDYNHPVLEKINYVFYAVVKNSPKFSSFKNTDFSWVGLGDISKLSFRGSSKQDVIVGERVINLQWRTDANITPEIAPIK